MVERSDKTTTPKAKQDVFFSDFMTNFRKHPNSGNLVRVTNESSVRQALVNLLLTDLGERLYQPLIGGDVRAALFEPLDNFAADMLETSIIRTIRNNEHRIDDLEVSCSPNNSQDGYDVSIAYTIINTKESYQFALVLTRIR